MYKIRNDDNRYLAITLEKGSISLKPGGSFDLDGVCSRKWIRENRDLRNLINNGFLRVLHDSEEGLPSAPINHPVKREKSLEDAKKEKPIIIDFSEIDDLVDMKDLLDNKEEEKEKTDKRDEFLETLFEEEEKPPTKEELPENSCPECGKVCKSAFGLRAHMRIHKKK